MASATIVTLLVLVATIQAAPHNCSVQYQAALVVDLKESCGETVYRACWEVGFIIHGVCLQFYLWG